jgi:glycosidase
MRSFALLALLASAGLWTGAPAYAQPVDVTFRFLPDLTTPPISPVSRAFVPGSFNDWGPNASGQIATGAPSQATYEPALNEYRYTTTLQAGQSYAYKVHYHRNGAGTDWVWLTDPLGTETTGPNNDSVVRVEDPFVFQIAREQNGTDAVQAVSAGVFGTAAVTAVTFTVNETTYTDGIENTGDGVYRLTLPEAVGPGAYVRVEATDADGRTASAEVGTIPPDVTDAPVPDGLEDGITYDPADPTRAWLVLRAPGKQFVYALGDFNGWTADEDALMVRDDTDALGTRWWIEITGLTPGVDSAFQYWVDGLIRVTDPYTTKVVYPGESGYPAGAVDHAVGVLTPGAEAFPWTDQDYVPPAQEDLVIYELLVRDFLRDHSFTALTDTLDYLERLGVNAIELMPVSEFDGDESWGYNPAFHLALDKYYGTPDEFKAFVDAAHARGMAVILDVVYNHATGQSPLVRLYNQGDFGPPTPDNPWANVEATHPFNVFNDLDHTSPLTQLWLDKANRFWADEYHVDGYRFDLTGGFYQTGSYFEYNPQRIGILTRMMDALWATNPNTIVILEHLVENGREWRELAAHRAGDDARPGPLLWHHMNREYSQSAMGYPTASDFPSTLTETWSPNWAGGIPVPNAVTYMESHDEQWMMYRNEAYGNAAGDYDVTDLFTGLDRQRLAGVFFFTVPGPRMLWQFGELGYGAGPGECLVNGDYPGECPNGVPGRVSNKPIRWDYWSDTAQPFRNGYSGTLTASSETERRERRELYATWAALLDLRANYEIFRSPDAEVTMRLGRVPDRWIRLSLPDAPAGQPTKAVIFGNFGVTEQAVTLTFDEAGTWYDYFDNTEAGLQAGSHTFTLRPGAYHVWTDVDVPSPAGDLGAVAEETSGTSPASEKIVAHPNPTAGRLALRIRTYTATESPVEVFDLLGRRVRSVPVPMVGAFGSTSVEVDTEGLPAGVYVVRWGRHATTVSIVR